MGACVCKYQVILSIILTAVTFTACVNDIVIETTLSEINSVEIEPQIDAHALQVKIVGALKCPVKLEILSNNNSIKTIELSGSVMENIRTDWYEQHLGFRMQSSGCGAENVIVKIRLFK